MVISGRCQVYVRWVRGAVTPKNPSYPCIRPFPIGSVYGILTYIYHQNQPNVVKYTSPMDPMGQRVLTPLLVLVGAFLVPRNFGSQAEEGDLHYVWKPQELMRGKHLLEPKAQWTRTHGPCYFFFGG